MTTTVLLIYLLIVNAAIFISNFLILIFNPRFLWAFLKIYFTGFMRTPYKLDDFRFSLVIRKNKISKDELIYGDTPILTAYKLFKQAGVFDKNNNKKFNFYDLGAGRGWMILGAKFFGAKISAGCDINPEHVALSKNILKKIGCEISLENSNKIKLNNKNKPVTHAYLAWTTWSRISRDKICENLRNLEEKARIITLTWEIDLTKFVEFEEIKRGTSFFSWGLANFYIYRRK